MIRRDLGVIMCNTARYKNKKSKLLQRRLSYEDVVPVVERRPTLPLPQPEQRPTLKCEVVDEPSVPTEDLAEHDSEQVAAGPEDELCIG
ncbi:hypothetical protein HOLleu_44723 [Holothuria leucospilota]|uniref:Uncharacterized protein n=1 Tax=Holothuria leucospilota TaxID=206669 RepID=A0A9Q1BA17_HOLLE|nr:hypothetical protein HOLleu_44723 [Holothuria leucospilota]